MTLHSIDTAALTIIATDENGEIHDLNEGGEPCTNLSELRAFVRELRTQGAYGVETESSLLAQIEARAAALLKAARAARTEARTALVRANRAVAGVIRGPQGRFGGEACPAAAPFEDVEPASLAECEAALAVYPRGNASDAPTARRLISEARDAETIARQAVASYEAAGFTFRG